MTSKRTTRSRSAGSKRRYLVLPALLVLLLLGIASGAALAAGTDDGSGTTDVTTTTADPGTDSTPATTTDEGTTTDVTTTDPATTTDPGTTDQTTTQAADPTTTTTPTAPCDTTAITCGNNAATQVALVTQTCNASSNSVIAVQVENLGGSPVNDFTINNNTTCLNEINLSQVVQQFCVNCTIIVVPPPTVQSVYVTQVVAAPTPDASPREAYCMPQPVLRGDGTWGTFVDLLAGQPQKDPRYAGAIPATYVPGVGLTCADGETTEAMNVPVFTLTVPASFVGQYVNLCLQPSNPKLPASCHEIRIDLGATISVPVTGHVTATVKQVAVPVSEQPKSKKQIANASNAIANAFVRATHPKKHSPAKKKTIRSKGKKK
jgi:hypothetical protein